ncbi:MAG: hypothetical protein JXJ04_18035, partial [Spirochaetales bacterium]|nr:hypothetical protein [Spirochaetales bacterium]
MRKLKEKIVYEFDNFMTQNPLSQILGLTIIVFIILLIGTIATSIVLRGENIPDDMQGGFGAQMWWNFMRVIDPGTITADDGFTIRILSLFSTVGGILIFSI